MSDEPVEIVARPPSSPIAIVLLTVCMLGTILAITVIWWELFTEYMPGTGPGSPPVDPEMKEHPVRSNAENHVIDHYAVDFKKTSDLIVQIQDELTVSDKIGDLTIVSGGGSSSSSSGESSGEGEAPPPAPPEEGGGG